MILSSGHASSSLWASEQHRLIKYMSAEDQEAIRLAEATGKWDDPDYLRANEHYFELYVTSIDENSPECLRRPKRSGKEAYLYGWGPNEYQPLGSLKDFEYTDKLGQILQPTLICPMASVPAFPSHVFRRCPQRVLRGTDRLAARA